MIERILILRFQFKREELHVHSSVWEVATDPCLLSIYAHLRIGLDKKKMLERKTVLLSSNLYPTCEFATGSATQLQRLLR